MSVNYLVLDNSITLNYNGKTLSIASGDSRYAGVLEAIREKDLDSIPAIVEVERGFEGSSIELRDGILYEGQEAIPTELNARVLKLKELRLPYDGLLNFWGNLKKNPSFNSRQQLFKFLEHNGHPLTDDGCFIAYRGVTEDFKDKQTRTFNNAPGAVCEMPRDQVDDNPNNTCSSGLHVACFDYAKGFGEKLVEVKVNPADVVCVPTDYNGTKMRTCRFEVVQECAEIRNEAIYGQPLPAQEEQEIDEEPCRDRDENCDGGEDCDDHCQECGDERRDGANFCGDCGNEF